MRCKKDETREKRIRKFKKLTIQDDFMFCKVMQKEEICRTVLNIVLEDYPIAFPIKLIASQATIENHSELKAVRLDVLVEDTKGNSYDIEMQRVNKKNIQKRMRMYQAAVDMDKMHKGMDYNELSDTIIIFFCPFDPIGAGLPIYFFETYCNQNKNIQMKDGTYKIIVNTSAWEKAEGERREFFRYIHEGKATGRVAKEMEMAIAAIKNNTVFMNEYVSFYASLTDARKDGVMSIVHNMKEKGYTIEEIMDVSGLTQEEIEEI